MRGHDQPGTRNPLAVGFVLAASTAFAVGAGKANGPGANPDATTRGHANSAGVAFFERKIRPVLVKECYSCHSAGARSIKGGLRLDTQAAARAGGDSGPAIVPGKPDESLLLDALRYDGPEMPPRGKLADEVVADFERWVRMGAPDPRDGPAVARGERRPRGATLEAGRAFWSYRPPTWHEPPRVIDRDWPLGAIDSFVLAQMEKRGLRPVREADRATLLRRLSFDLIGLPPTFDEIQAFVNDPAPDAYERLVDRLMASPHFGERWGRHWLDVARFAESLTLRGFVLKEAWRYRDHVVRAFNIDEPYSRFVAEQIAGDLLPSSGWADHRAQMIAASFLALGNTNLEDQDKAQLDMDVVDEQLDTIGKAFLAQTIGCARCHDHKFDPIPTSDYYAMAGILHNVQALKHSNVSHWLERPLPAPSATEAAVEAHESAIAVLESIVKSARAKAPKSKPKAKAKTKAKAKPTPELARARAKAAALEACLKRMRASGPRPEQTMAVVERTKLLQTPIHLRGNVHNLGRPVHRGFLQVASVGDLPEMTERESGRRELAAWLSSAENPLTARVIVNRAWYWLMGAGIVRTVDNFGTTGEKPSHPELLDRLALQFVRDGWSIKALVRRIVVSRTYRLAAIDDPRSASIDPENRLRWRGERRRLDAECLRDAVLQTSGALRQKMGGPSYPAALAADYGFPQVGTRRGVYVPVFRNVLPVMFQVFDFADPSRVVGRRDTSTVATQALFMLNDPFVLEQSRLAARRLLDLPGLDQNARLRRAVYLAWGRAPKRAEFAALQRFLQTDGGGNANGPSGAPATSDDLARWTGIVQALFASADFRYID